MSGSKTSSDHIALELLSQAHSASVAEKLFTEKVKQRPLLLQPTRTISAADDRQRRRLARLRKKEHYLRKQKPRPLSAREKRALGVYDVPKEEAKYAIYVKLHDLWLEYMWDLLGLSHQTKQVTATSHGNLLATADYHGAKIEVVRSKCAGRIGLKGIVVRDTKFTFMVITEKDQLRTIPKDNNVFRFEIPWPPKETQGMESAQETALPLQFELYGEQFQYRPADRANKKFKWQSLENL